MRAHLRTGAAIFNEGRYHAAHDAWEDYWLDLESGTDDELLLHGLIQFTAVVHHATNGNESGARGLAESAGGYLADLPADFRGVDLDDVRPFLATIAADPGAFDPESVPALRHDGEALTYDDLGFEATAVAAHVLAEEDGYDEESIERAAEYARGEVEENGGGPFTGLLFSFVREPDKRGVIAQRLSAHVDRERAKDADVDGLFEES